MCLGTWLRWDIQQNVSPGSTSAFLLLSVCNGAGSRHLQGHGRPPLLDGNTHCSGGAKGELAGCKSSHLQQAASPPAGASCEEAGRAAYLSMREAHRRPAGFHGDARAIFRSHLFFVGNRSKRVQVL